MSDRIQPSAQDGLIEKLHEIRKHAVLHSDNLSLSADQIELVLRAEEVTEVALRALRSPDSPMLSVADASLLEHNADLVAGDLAVDVISSEEELSNASKGIRGIERLVRRNFPTSFNGAGFAANIDEFLRAHQRRLQRLEEEQRNRFEKEASVRADRIDQALARMEDQFSKAQERRGGDFLESQTARIRAYDELLSERESKNSEVMSSASMAISHAVSTIDDLVSKQVTSFLDDVASRRDRLFDELGRASALDLEEIAKQRNRSEELVGVIAQTGMVHGYQRSANSARNASRSWLAIAGTSLVGFIAMAVWTSIRPGEPVAAGAVNSAALWIQFATKAFGSLSFLALAAFGAAQAAQQSAVERRSRQMELELASLGPFLQQIPEPERPELVKKLAEKMFAQSTEMHVDKRSVKLPMQALLETIKTLAEQLGNRK